MSKFENDIEKYKWFFFYAIAPDMDDKEKDFKWKMALDKFNHLNKSKIESKFENELLKRIDILGQIISDQVKKIKKLEARIGDLEAIVYE